MKLLAFLLLLPFVGWTQQPPACTWKATATVSGAQSSFPNNTASPICNAFALSWNSTGFSGVSIELQGSDNNASWTTFTGTSTVLVGTNPQTGLTGTIIIQASATLAFIRVNLTSLTGSGSVSYQIYGYNGVTPAAKTGGGGSGGTCAALGGDLSGTCTAATVVGVNGAAVPASATLTGTNSSKQIIAATLPNADIYVGSAGNLPVGVAVSGDVGLANDGTMTVSGTSGLMLPALAQVLGTNISRQIIPAPLQAGQIFVGNVSNVPTAVAPSGNVSMSNIGAFTVLGVITGAGATTTTNGNLIYDTTANNLHAANNSGDAIVPVTTVTPGNGNCTEWVVSGGTLKLGDAGSPCGSGSGGGGIVTYSSSADTLLGTQYLPPGGGAPLNSTESDNQVASPAAATISNFHVQVSAALGIGASAVFTWRDGGSSQTLTCTISGAVAVSCADTTHSFNVAAGDLIDVLVVTTGTPGVVNILFTAAFGTSNVGITSIFGNMGPTITTLNVPTGDSLQPTGTGTITATQVPTAATASTTTNGVIIYDTTNDNLHTSSGSADAVVAVTPTATPVNGDCAQWTKVSGKIQLGDAGAACGSGSGGGTGYVRGTTAGKSACGAGANGRIYYATDSVLSYGCNGTSDQAYDGTIAVTPPGSLGSLTTVTGTGGVVTQDGDTVLIQAIGTTTSPTGFYTTTSVSPTSSIVSAAFNNIFLSAPYSICGVGIYSTTSQGFIFGMSGYSATNQTAVIGTWTLGVGNGFTSPPTVIPVGSATRFRLRYVSTTSVIPELSQDAGTTWTNPAIGTIPGTFNPSGFTHQFMGIFCGNQSGGSVATALVTHFAFQ